MMKKVLLITAFVFLCGVLRAQAAVSFLDSNKMSPIGTVGSPTPLTASITAGQSNVVAVACVDYYLSVVSSSISGVTYGGNAMTSAGTVQNSGNNFVQAFYLVNPPTGSNNLAVSMTCTGGCSGYTSSYLIYADLVSFSNVNQTTPIRPGSYATANSSTLVISSNPSDLTQPPCLPRTKHLMVSPPAVYLLSLLARITLQRHLQR
jgi:hypothetical protein